RRETDHHWLHKAQMAQDRLPSRRLEKIVGRRGSLWRTQGSAIFFAAATAHHRLPHISPNRRYGHGLKGWSAKLTAGRRVVRACRPPACNRLHAEPVTFSCRSIDIRCNCRTWERRRMSELPPEIDTSRPHPARIYDYGLGGKNHFAADREVADKIIESWPAVRTAGRENRAFLGRTVRYLAAEKGIRQFLDIGTGLPTTNNVHEVAQDVAPSCHVVYADNDPLVLAHAQALLTSAPAGRTAYIQADLRA